MKGCVVEKFFSPQSVAVIGASASAFNLGGTICLSFRNLDFPEQVYAVNVRGEDVHGYPGYKTVLDIPDEVDLAIIIISARFVPQALRDCGTKGIMHVIIESAGFSEDGEHDLQAQVDAVADEYGIRYMGPNCLGILDARQRFCCFFGAGGTSYADIFMRPGEVTYIVQSGGVGVLMMDELMRDVARINKVISIGNKGDIDEADLIEYLESDSSTSVICIYLENVRDGRKLLQAARQATKPILVYKVGRTAEGSKAAMSHTAGLANNDVVFGAACKQGGITRCRTIDELHALPKIFTAMPHLKGERIAVFTNSGAFGGIVTDLLVENGLQMARFPDEMQQRLKEAGQVYNSANPIDLGPELSTAAYVKIFDILLSANMVDGLLAVPSVWQDFVIDALIELVTLCRKYDKPAAIYLPNGTERAIQIRNEHELPIFLSPEEAARALHVSLQHYQALQRKACLDLERAV